MDGACCALKCGEACLMLRIEKTRPNDLIPVIECMMTAEIAEASWVFLIISKIELILKNYSKNCLKTCH